MNELKLAALLSSRLCHDLIGPIGAINNGVELFSDEDDPAMKEQALQLVTSSAVEASRRLQFYRLAFGAASGMGSEIGLGEARRAADGLFMSGKIKLIWPPDDGVPLDKAIAKLLLNMVLIGAGSLARGGTLSVNVSRQAGTLRLNVAAAGDRANVSEAVMAALSEDYDEASVDAHSIQPWFTRLLAKSLGAKVTVQRPGDGQVVLFAAL